MKISVITGELFEKALSYCNEDNPFACEIFLSIKAANSSLKSTDSSLKSTNSSFKSTNYGKETKNKEEVVCDWIFCLIDEKGNIKAVIKSVYGGYVCFSKDIDKETLDGFCDFYLFNERKTFYSDEKLILPLQRLIGGKISKRTIMKRKALGGEALETKFSSLEKAYKLLEEAFPQDCRDELFEKWQYQTFRKGRLGGKAYVSLEENGEAISCGFVDGANELSFLLSSLAVRENSRKQGEGSKVVKKLLQALPEGKSVYVVLFREELEEFYRKNGFSFFEFRFELEP